MLLVLAPRSRSFARQPSRWLASRRRYLNADHSVYVSRSTDPYFNLSLEDWLFRHKNHDEPLLFLYRNDPCIVIGRNQNPWKEVNLEQAALRDIPFLRRRSGGGTVFHDLGNSNYSIHVSRSSFDRKATADVVVRAVRSLGVPAEVNERNDICASGFKICSAYKIASQRAYHHGTMLISTDLTALGDVLHTTKVRPLLETMVTKGVASVRSPVRNLHDFGANVTHDDFVDAVVESFQSEYQLSDNVQIVGGEEDEPLLQEGILELKSWEWRFGQTPEFRYTISQQFEWGIAEAEIESKHGIVLSCRIACPGIDHADLQKMEGMLKGSKYGFMDCDLTSSSFSGSSESVNIRCNEILCWLERTTRS